MKQRTLRAWFIVGAFVIFGLAALWHFVYAWIPSGVTAVIFPVNESVWEHVKLFFFPAIIYYVLQYFAIGRRFRNFIFSAGLSLLIMPGLALALFYFYREGLGIAESLLIDIIITFACICIGQFIAYKMTIRKRLVGRAVIAWVIALLMLIALGLLTFFVPKTGIFMDNGTKGYGIEGHAGADHSHDGEEADAHEGEEDVHDEDDAHEGEEDVHDEDEHDEEDAD